jgi:uncharacterized protein YbjT (DUF2867 family)
MVLVVGATGVVGGMITRRLLERGDEVRILVRTNSPSEQLAREGRATSAEELIAAGASPAYGDMRDRASLDAALEGVRAVVSTANSVGRGGDDNVRTVDLEGNRNLIEAARDAGVGRFVFISALGAAVEKSCFTLALGLQEGNGTLESGMAYAILAPNTYMEVWVAVVVGMPALQGRPVVLVEEGRRRHSFVSNRDVAAFAAAAVDHPAARNRHILIGGPEALSWRDVLATYERVLGRQLPVEFVAVGDPVPLPDPTPDLLAAMETYDSVIEMEEVSRTFDVTLTKLETFVREQVAPQHT